MTPQDKKGSRGVEWADYTLNVNGGCSFGAPPCKWLMPDGKVVSCYAERMASSKAIKGLYPLGFGHHYPWPARALQPGAVKRPSMIFVDSMSDTFGPKAKEEDVMRVLDMARKYDWHVYQVLTKAPGGLQKYLDRVPQNMWVGVSSPPDWFMGERLSVHQKASYIEKALKVLGHARELGLIAWMSIEPLTWDIAPLLQGHPLDWAVIGGGSGQGEHAVDETHFRNCIELFDSTHTPVFVKENAGRKPVYEDFPVTNGPPPAVVNRQQKARQRGWPLNRFLSGMASMSQPSLGF